MSLSRYIDHEEKRRSLPAPGLSTLILQMSYASKALAREIRRAALVGKLGLVGEKNPTGDAQTKLDV